MREEFKNELFRIATTRAKANQFNFTAILESDLRQLIDRAVNNMSYADYSSDAKKTEARVNTLMLIDSMTIDGRERRLTESLDYKSLTNVISRICPLWPFC